MPHYYSALREPIELELATDDIGVRFGGKRGPAAARRAFRAIAPGPRAARAFKVPPVRQFHRFMIMHDSGAAEAQVASIVSALPRKLVSRVERPLPVFIEKHSRLRLVATEEVVASNRA